MPDTHHAAQPAPSWLNLPPLRAAGLAETQIIDAAAVAAYFNFSNRLNSALGVPPNLESYTAHRGAGPGV